MRDIFSFMQGRRFKPVFSKECVPLCLLGRIVRELIAQLLGDQDSLMRKRAHMKLKGACSIYSEN
ncbi:MAG: hypothetical protein KKH12_10115 [Gammaproteobacteria bacterium]|nr:hypothetical protein [Gammaproteobacteria bacterium]MBU1482016.1 hypothetical protein [Gammaproteobacteria bacterium]